MQSLRILPDLRSSVLEEMPATQAALFTSRRSDADAALLAAHPGVRAFTWPELVRALRDPELEILEVAEPLWVAEWVRALRAVALARALRPGRPGRRRVRVATYAIENLDARERLRPASLDAHPRLRAVVVALRVLALGVSLRALDAVVFGTSGARENYRDAFGWSLRRIRHTVLVPRTGVCSVCGPVAAGGDRTVLFLGAPSARKGFDVLTDAWLRCGGADRGWRLVVADPDPDGAGDPRPAPGVTVRVAPSRAAVHGLLRRGSVVAMPSVRRRGWREQIGLPLLEGLAHGCRVVTTTETGLADDLLDHPLVTLTTPGDPASLADGLTRAMDDAEGGVFPAVGDRGGHTKSDVLAWWLAARP